MKARVILICLAIAGRVHAQSADESTERARAHLRAGIAYYDEGRYPEAVHEMQAAYSLVALPDLQYDLAQCYERLARYEDAASAYEQYLRGNPSADDRQMVQTRIANLRARAQSQDAAPPPPVAEKIVFKTIVVYRSKPAPPGRGARIASYGLAALALGAAASGAAFAVLAANAAHSVASDGNPALPVPFDGPARDAQQSGKTDVIVSGFSFAVAALGAGGAVGLYLLGRKIDREAPKLSLAPLASPSVAGVLVAGRF
jgi:tetratricopeptide (TPR) repeat protein